MKARCFFKGHDWGTKNHRTERLLGLPDYHLMVQTFWLCARCSKEHIIDDWHYEEIKSYPLVQLRMWARRRVI